MKGVELMKLILLILSILSIINPFSIFDSPKTDAVDTVVYEVQKGDTLWNIANQFAGDDVYIRKVIYTIEKDNEINGVLTPGQKLMIRK